MNPSILIPVLLAGFFASFSLAQPGCPSEISYTGRSRGDCELLRHFAIRKMGDSFVNGSDLHGGISHRQGSRVKKDLESFRDMPLEVQCRVLSKMQYDNFIKYTKIRPLDYCGRDPEYVLAVLKGSFGSQALVRAIDLYSNAQILPILVEELLKDSRVDPGAWNNLAIRSASENGQNQVVDRLLKDARVDPRADFNFAICMAAEYGHIMVVDRLLQDKKVDPSAMDNHAISIAVQNGHLPVVERLLQDPRVSQRANLNELIDIATENGHEDTASALGQLSNASGKMNRKYATFLNP